MTFLVLVGSSSERKQETEKVRLFRKSLDQGHYRKVWAEWGTCFDQEKRGLGREKKRVPWLILWVPGLARTCGSY